MPEERQIFNLAPAVPTENILLKMRQRFAEYSGDTQINQEDLIRGFYEAAWIGMCVPHIDPPEHVRQSPDGKSIFVYNKDKHVYDQFDLVEPQE